MEGRADSMVLSVIKEVADTISDKLTTEELAFFLSAPISENYDGVTAMRTN